MDELFSIIWAVIHWRFVMSVLLSIVMALFLSNSIDPFTSEYCVGVVAIGFFTGIYWQGKAGL